MTTIEDQVALLLQPPSPKSLETKDGFTYIGHQYIRVSLNRIFGFGGWSFDLTSVECIGESKVPKSSGQGENFRVTYRVTGRLVVTFVDGTSASYTETCVDSSFHPQYDQCHDHAVKGAASGALRRAAMNLGSVFGLGLYFSPKGGVFAGEIVRHTIQHADTTDPQATHDALRTKDDPEGDTTGEEASASPRGAQSLDTPEAVAAEIERLQADSRESVTPEWTLG